MSDEELLGRMQKEAKFTAAVAEDKRIRDRSRLSAS